MKLTAKTDLDAPAEFLHACLCDTTLWEREASRRGVEIERPADMPLTGVGAGWRARVPFRGRVRKVLLRLDELTGDRIVAYSFDGQALVGTVHLETTSLSARRSRLKVIIDAKPRTLAARLFLNTLRLARRKAEDRMEKRVGQLGALIAERYTRDRG
jgi:hypothetical protein